MRGKIEKVDVHVHQARDEISPVSVDVLRPRWNSSVASRPDRRDATVVDYHGVRSARSAARDIDNRHIGDRDGLPFGQRFGLHDSSAQQQRCDAVNELRRCRSRMVQSWSSFHGVSRVPDSLVPHCSNQRRLPSREWTFGDR